MGCKMDFSGLSLAPSGKVQRTFTTVDTEAQRDFDIIRNYFIFFSMSMCLCGEVVYPYKIAKSPLSSSMNPGQSVREGSIGLAS